MSLASHLDTCTMGDMKDKMTLEELHDMVCCELEWAESEGFDEECAFDNFWYSIKDRVMMETVDARQLWNNIREQY